MQLGNTGWTMINDKAHALIISVYSWQLVPMNPEQCDPLINLSLIRAANVHLSAVDYDSEVHRSGRVLHVLVEKMQI